MNKDWKAELEKLKSMEGDEAFKYASELLRESISEGGRGASEAQFGVDLAEAYRKFMSANLSRPPQDVIYAMIPFLFDAFIVPCLKISGFPEKLVVQYLPDIRKEVMLGAMNAFEKYVKDNMSPKSEMSDEELFLWLEQQAPTPDSGDRGPD